MDKSSLNKIVELSLCEKIHNLQKGYTEENSYSPLEKIQMLLLKAIINFEEQLISSPEFEIMDMPEMYGLAFEEIPNRNTVIDYPYDKNIVGDFPTLPKFLVT